MRCWAYSHSTHEVNMSAMTAWLFLVLLFSSPAFGQEISIGMSLALKGKYAEMGNMQKRGISLWQKHVNQKGGILGKKVALTVIDDESSPEKAREIYQRLIEQDRMDLVIGPYSSGITEAILPVTEKNRYPVLLSGASADHLWEKGYRYAFGMYTPASKYAVGFLQMMVRYQMEDLAIISADDAFSTALSQATRKWARRFRLNVVSFRIFEKGKKDLDDIVMAAKTAGAEALVVCGHLDESVDIRRTLKRIVWRPKAYFASVGPATKQFYHILKEDADLTFSSSQWEKEVGIKFPGGKEFIEGFALDFEMVPTYHAATAYAAGMILETALNKSGTLDREALRDVLASLDTMTVIGRYGVDSKGKQKRHFPMIIQWQHNRKNVVWPDTLKVLDPVFQ